MPDSAPSLEDARAILQDTWGYTDFRPGQDEIIEAVLEKRDVLGVLPTGGGKSICYQVPSLLGDGFTMVISPLIALMQDQVAGLKARGIEAAFINSTLSHREIDQRWTDAEHGRYRLLYVAPERLESDMFEARASRLNVSLLAVDEAHCVSEWGHHFRPAYLKIPEGRELLDNPPTIAVTATATPYVRKDVIEHLELDDPLELVHGFDRPNIVWSVFRTESKKQKVSDVLGGVVGSGIVYASTRRGVNTWTRWLEAQGVSAAGYHGGLESSERSRIQDEWVEGATRVIVATNAFGMGIDKSDVRFVVHVDLPDSIEAYYQEAGRGGRDGKPSYAVLLFQPPDAETQEALIESAHPSGKEVRTVYDAICNAGQVPIGSEPDGPVVVNEEVVMKLTDLSRGKIKTSIELLERQDAIRVLPRRRHDGLIRFEEPANALRNYAHQLENRRLATFVQDLLRTVHADAFSGWWRLDLRRLVRRTELERERVSRGLEYLAERGLLTWHPPGDALRVELTIPRAQKLPVDDRGVTTAKKRAAKRLKYMLRYARSSTCRRRFLLTYFGETASETCGTCDVCLGRHEVQPVTPEDEETLRHILKSVAEGEERDSWFDDPGERVRYQVDRLVDWLVRHDYLSLKDPLDERYVVTEKASRFL
ncbi:RecQ family ATP-dependent DNA helicase [Longibacter salinarum]|uniref:ATP-dependent DNA helicase RecQ n=1 Tax=Longibacter salinarum TaxID=1850348 RepID=A0A2A8CW57_9BACT|nr:ATP-dependent DNA helicase RecQ [Longibacter salinarum]PEN12886.1 RecQ family ATP-dependent DNA helicase [Longibacter salinarum]